VARDRLLGLITLIAVLTFRTNANPAAARQVFEGRVSVVRDVDIMIVVAGAPVRLNGIDGPEISNRYGRGTKAFMDRLVRGQTVPCDLNDERRYDRWVGVCYIAKNRRLADIGAIAIAHGPHLTLGRYSGGRYRSLEPSGARSGFPQARYC